MQPTPKVKKNTVSMVQQELLKSEAWLSLSGIAPQVYLLFLTKRRMERIKRGGTKRYICTNGNELVFTYREALTKYGITQPRFLRTIDMLIDRGFIDIARPGSGCARVETHYALSERWRDYGKPSFQPKMRNQVRVGFCGKRTEQGK